MAYVARYTGDQDLLAACHRFWDDLVKRQMYVTGSIGATTSGEALTYDYDLPNDTMYGETCAAVGMAFFARQMLHLDAKAEYADVLEKELFNGALSGMSLDGKHFFYVNPLEADPKASRLNPGKSHVLTHRADWFGCACCPANLARLITSVDQYLYTVTDQQTILSHQFIANRATFNNGVEIDQTNHFPWAGDIHYTVTVPQGLTTKLGLRIPGWSPNFTLKVNGKDVDPTVDHGFVYLTLTADTTIDLTLDMTVKFMQANNRVSADYGQVAVQRGPIVYAAEEADNPAPLWQYRVDPSVAPTYQYDKKLLNGVGIVTVAATKPASDASDAPLYQPLQLANDMATKLKLIPYYAWANRENGQMRVWFHR